MVLRGKHQLSIIFVLLSGAFLLLFTVLSMILSTRLAEGGRTGPWVAFLLVSIAAPLSYLAAVFLFIVQGIFLLINRTKLSGRWNRGSREAAGITNLRILNADPLSAGNYSASEP